MPLIERMYLGRVALINETLKAVGTMVFGPPKGGAKAKAKSTDGRGVAGLMLGFVAEQEARQTERKRRRAT